MAGSAPTRRRHHKAEKLSDEAVHIIEEGLARSVPYDEIAARVAAETFDTISKAALGRYYRAKFAPRREAQRTAAAMAHEMASFMNGTGPDQLRNAIEARTAQQLFPMIEELARDKPEHAAYFYASITARRTEEMKIGQRMAALELAKQKLDLEKRQVEAKLGEIARRLESAAGAGKEQRPRTKAELEQTIRDLYGLARAPADTSANSGSEPRQTGDGR